MSYKIEYGCNSGMIMKKCYYTLYFLSLFCIYGISQETEDFPSVDTSDLPDAAIGNPKTYSRTSLFGYINGGAELYLEYGFSGAHVNEIRLKGGIYTVEIYRMNGPEEAFGIFSVSRFRCSSTPSFSPYSCQTPYQLQLCTGSFYISISNNTGSPTDSAVSLRIGESIVNRIKEEPANVADYLPGISHETINREAVLVKGELGIANGAPDLAEYFGEIKGYTAVLLRGKDKDMVSVRFSSQENLASFLHLHQWNPEMISASPSEMPTGEVITRLSEQHLLISINR